MPTSAVGRVKKKKKKSLAIEATNRIVWTLREKDSPGFWRILHHSTAKILNLNYLAASQNRH